MQAQLVQNEQQEVALPLRAHTILGVCEAIGEDFGFNPAWLRVPLAASVLVSPMWAIISYFALGLIVLASRLLFPKVSKVEAPKTAELGVPANEQREMAKAA